MVKKSSIGVGVGVLALVVIGTFQVRAQNSSSMSLPSVPAAPAAPAALEAKVPEPAAEAPTVKEATAVPAEVAAPATSESEAKVSPPAGLVVPANAATEEAPKKRSKYDPVQPYNPEFQTVDKAIKNKEFQEDDKITDPRLRAAAGSLSRYSINSNFSILGPRVGNFDDPSIPNPDKKNKPSAQTLRGTISGRYRLDADHSLGFGAGVSFNHPLQGFDRTDASTPFLSYNIANRIGATQFISSPGVSYATIPEYVNSGQVGSANIQNSLVRGLGHSRFALSFDLNASYFFYNRGYVPGQVRPRSGQVPKQRDVGGGAAANTAYGDGIVDQYNFSAGPGLKYNFSDHLNVYWSVEMNYFNPRSESNASTLRNSTPSSRLGVGYAYSRNVYIAPYIQTYPTVMSPDMTTINISTIFSLL